MSAQTLIIFVIFKLPKHPKTLKYASKYIKYPRDCILYVSDAKWVKTMKNEQSLHNWQFQSPNFQKFTKLVPEHVFWKKSQPKAFKSQKSSNIVLRWKLWENYIFGPYTLQVWQNQSLGTLRCKIYFVTLMLLECGKSDPWSYFGKMAWMVLVRSFGNLDFQAFKFWKVTKLVLVLLILQTKRTIFII